jgi:acyl-coenzyme A synthetase/AMP-(fatty) acid ligase
MSPRRSSHLLSRMIVPRLAAGGVADVALLSGDRSVTYGALAGAVMCGAADIDRRLEPGSRLLIAVRDQLHVAVALAAALQSRSVPLLADPNSPERLRALAAEWSVAAGVVEPDVDLAAVERIDRAIVANWLAAEPLDAFDPRPVSADEPAFWTFTSGTTGEPKAVVHSHGGPVAAYETFARGIVALGPEDVTIATAGLPFVYALGNNFLFPLMAGATAVLPSDLLLPTVLGELARHGATLLVAGPWSLSGIARLARRSRWIEALARLRCVLSAGEPLPARVFAEWQQRFGKEVLDNLGCTEMFNSFVSNVPGRARAGSLGTVVRGFEIRIGGRPAAPGARGGLEVRGRSRAIFVGSAGTLAPPKGEWCDTGDEVALDERGEVAFLGRRDDRFKVKGRFLHPVEVERVVASVPGVVECLACGEQNEDGLTILSVKVVAEARHDAAELVHALFRAARARLEPHAQPARIEIVDSLPRSARGKLLRA